MIPSECARSTESRAEILLFEAMRKQLPAEWTVFHSLGLLDKGRGGRVLDAELDFAVLHPRLGILVVEVKGGIIACKDGTWTQNGWRLDKSPARQAADNKYALMRYLKRSSHDGFVTANFAHAVCFPDCFDMETPPPDCEGICITGRDMPYLAEAVEKILSEFHDNNHHMTESDAAFILKKLAPAFDYGIALSDNVHISEAKIVQLTEQQCEMLNFISGHKRALIRGCAGSGKTVLALKKARELAASGANVLLLAYNSLLCDKLKCASAGEERINATTFHDLCTAHLQANGLDLSPRRNDDKVWTETIPAEFMNMLAKAPLHFDAVIVDEGQDFRRSYWDSVAKLVRDDGHFYIFYDPDQNLYNDQLALPELGVPFVLDKNCRNTAEIFNALKPYCSGNVRISDLAPAGLPVREVRNCSGPGRREALAEILSSLSQGGLFERQIVVLGGHSMSKTCIGSNPRVGKFEMVENGPHDIGRIPYFTYMKFKGCEADAVILLDVSDDDPRWNKEGLCTAISRAKHVLCIVRK